MNSIEQHEEGMKYGFSDRNILSTFCGLYSAIIMLIIYLLIAYMRL